MKKLIIVLVFLVSSCGLSHIDEQLIVYKIEPSMEQGYKFKYSIQGQVKVYTFFHSNQIFNVGDTLKLSR